MKKTLGLSNRAMTAVMNYDWPGNIRELENIIERGIIMTDPHESIGMDSLFPGMVDTFNDVDALSESGHLVHADAPHAAASAAHWSDSILADNVSLEDVERVLIEKAMANCNGNVSKAARQLGMTRPAFSYRLSKYDDGE